MKRSISESTSEGQRCTLSRTNLMTHLGQDKTDPGGTANPCRLPPPQALPQPMQAECQVTVPPRISARQQVPVYERDTLLWSMWQARQERRELTDQWRGQGILAEMATPSGNLPPKLVHKLIPAVLLHPDQDDLRPQLRLLRDLGRVNRSLALAVENVMGDEALATFRQHAAHYERQLLDHLVDEAEYGKQLYLGARWNVPAIKDQIDWDQFGRYFTSLQEFQTDAAFHPALPPSPWVIGLDAYPSAEQLEALAAYTQAYADKIVSLTIPTTTEATPDWQSEAYARCKHLQSLTIRGPGAGAGEHLVHLNWLENLQNLTELDVSQMLVSITCIPYPALAKLDAFSVSFYDLKQLLEQHPGHMETQGWMGLRKLCIKFGRANDPHLRLPPLVLPPDLKELKMSFMSAKLAATLPASLEVLELDINSDDYKGRPEEFAEILSCIGSRCANLAKIRLTVPRSTEEGKKLLELIHGGHERLKRLDLDFKDFVFTPERNNPNTFLTLVAVCIATSLEELTLRNCPVDATFLQALASVLHVHPQLKVLKIAGSTRSRISELPPELMTAMATHPGLRKISLYVKLTGNKSLNLLRDLARQNRRLLHVSTRKTSHDTLNNQARDNWRY